MVEATFALELLLEGQRLKITPRTGWLLRGVVDAESVADHTFGVAFTTLLLTQMIDAPVDIAKALTIAILHDLPEAVTGDIPMPAQAYFKDGGKREAEARVLAHLLDNLAAREVWQDWWREFEEGTSIEGRLVHDADRLDVLLQAYMYEMATGNRLLAEFWTSIDETDFAFAASKNLCVELKEMRRNKGDT